MLRILESICQYQRLEHMPSLSFHMSKYLTKYLWFIALVFFFNYVHVGPLLSASPISIFSIILVNILNVRRFQDGIKCTCVRDSKGAGQGLEGYQTVTQVGC